jgi:hypothetical protein
MGRRILRLDSNDGRSKGYHTRDHRVDRSGLLCFFRQLVQIEIMELNGCSDWPHLRLCNGCNDIFARNIASIKYANLTKLRIVNMYMNGSRLSRFTKEHASTLIDIECISITLTDSSWRSIAQSLLKVAELTKLLFWKHLYQKPPMRSTKQAPLEWLLDEDEVIVGYMGTETIHSSLRHFINYFETLPYDPPDWDHWVPQYHCVQLFAVPGLVEECKYEPGAYFRVERYAEEIFIE